MLSSISSAGTKQNRGLRCTSRFCGDIRFTAAGRDFALGKGETIHTESSLKYAIGEARVLLRAAGWSPVGGWTDEREYFSLILVEKRPTVSGVKAGLSDAVAAGTLC